MPLEKPGPHATKSERRAVAPADIATERRAGKPPAQAEAIGLSEAGLARHAIRKAAGSRQGG